MGESLQAEAPGTSSDCGKLTLSSAAVPHEAPPTLDAPPPMPPPPYFKRQFIDPSSFKAAISSKVEQPLVSLFRLSVRLLQFIFALASGISYAIELRHGNGRGDASSSFVFSQITFGATLLVLIINGVTVRYYRVSWMIDWILLVFWSALFAVFYQVYFGSDMTPSYSGLNTVRMERAVWCNLVNAWLWLGSALFSTIMCCSGTKASIKGKLSDRRRRKQKNNLMETMEDMEMGTIRT